MSAAVRVRYELRFTILRNIVERSKRVVDRPDVRSASGPGREVRAVGARPAAAVPDTVDLTTVSVTCFRHAQIAVSADGAPGGTASDRSALAFAAGVERRVWGVLG